MSTNWRQEDIAITDLSLWDENARFPDKYFKQNEKDLIKYFCLKTPHRDFKIIELAEAIVRDFDLPQLEKVIIYQIDGKNIVLEGNRRVVVYKLLDKPNLAPTALTKKIFEELKSKIKSTQPLMIESLVTNNEIEGFRFIERKHLNNNFLPWNEQERTNYKKRRGNATKKEEFKIEIAKIIRKIDIPEELKEQILGPGYVTNFWRIIDSTPAWKEFGFALNSAGKLMIADKDFVEKLKVIIVNVLKKEDFSGNKIDSRSLNKNEEKENYLTSIKQSDYKKYKDIIKDNTLVNIFNESNVILTKPNRLIPKSTGRNYLISKTCHLFIQDNKKINNIYRELRDDLVLDKTVNAVGVLFRVFLEASIDFYLQKKGIVTEKEIKLSGKISKVADDMESKKIATSNQLLNIRKVGTNNPSILSIDNFHDYVHSLKVIPTPDDLILKWDNLEEFFQILWDHFKPRSK